MMFCCLHLSYKSLLFLFLLYLPVRDYPIDDLFLNKDLSFGYLSSFFLVVVLFYLGFLFLDVRYLLNLRFFINSLVFLRL